MFSICKRNYAREQNTSAQDVGSCYDARIRYAWNAVRVSYLCQSVTFTNLFVKTTHLLFSHVSQLLLSQYRFHAESIRCFSTECSIQPLFVVFNAFSTFFKRVFITCKLFTSFDLQNRYMKIILCLFSKHKHTGRIECFSPFTQFEVLARFPKKLFVSNFGYKYLFVLQY